VLPSSTKQSAPVGSLARERDERVAVERAASLKHAHERNPRHARRTLRICHGWNTKRARARARPLRARVARLGRYATCTDERRNSPRNPLSCSCDECTHTDRLAREAGPQLLARRAGARVGFIVDGDDYYRALAESFARAERSIAIVGGT
jgi:hypothetical protein